MRSKNHEDFHHANVNATMTFEGIPSTELVHKNRPVSDQELWIYYCHNFFMLY
jgi:hypothetical protein